MTKNIISINRIIKNLFENSLVAEFSCDEEETRLENAHIDSDRDGVEILELHLLHHVFVHFHRDFENVPLLRLDQEKEHGFGSMGSRANEDHASLGIVQVILFRG